MAGPRFVRYRNLSGRSGVRAYARVGEETLLVRFADGGVYLYDAQRPGADDVAAMLARACAGRGLATYINQHVRDRYRRRVVAGELPG